MAYSIEIKMLLKFGLVVLFLLLSGKESTAEDCRKRNGKKYYATDEGMQICPKHCSPAESMCQKCCISERQDVYKVATICLSVTVVIIVFGVFACHRKDIFNFIKGIRQRYFTRVLSTNGENVLDNTQSNRYEVVPLNNAHQEPETSSRQPQTDTNIENSIQTSTEIACTANLKMSV